VALPGWATRSVAFGGDTAVLTTVGDPLSMVIARVASSGSVATPLRPIATSVSLGKTWNWNIARRGPDAVMAWLSATGDIQLARVLY
jgi:hypothetical protein